ncbi:MAG: SRPBCC domain-containing protein [Thermoplasmata archaeon]|nr:SRPBCC domain-containing protein [Thermoplasmata archaeon]
MPDEELDPILIQVTVPLPISMIHAALLDPAQLRRSFCDDAKIEPRLGGVYQLTFQNDPGFTSSGRITRLTPEVDVGYTWLAPPPHDDLMNSPEPRTHVYLRLQDSPEGIDVTLEHAGWGSGEAWEEARSFHFRLWDDRLHRFKEQLLRDAYG